ncbi:hypothetical protein ACFXJ8_22815 [Nonomuraea sp. NPDC059194]|uniref:hypothetical protein n=1 Tax=Nonomuraea sp. NPDC059194 TaxID=3346764 RepID=UPI0036C0DE37
MSTKQDLAETTGAEETTGEEVAAAATIPPADTTVAEPADRQTAVADAADRETTGTEPSAAGEEPKAASKVSKAAGTAPKVAEPERVAASSEPVAASSEPEGGGEPKAVGAGDVGAGRTGSRTRWRGVAIGAVLALVLATAGVTAVLQWISADRLQSRLAPLEHDRLLRLEVSGAASAFATTLLSYDYKDLQTTRGKVIAMTSGDFLATYDEAFGGPMEQVIVKLEAVSKATVREVYLSELDDASAKALVSVDQQVTSKEAVRNVLGTHLKLVMIKQKGVWKVSDVTVLGAAKETETKLDKKG